MRDNSTVINAFLFIILASAFQSIVSSSSSSSRCCIDRARVGHIGHPNIAEIRFKVDAASHYNLRRGNMLVFARMIRGGCRPCCRKPPCRGQSGREAAGTILGPCGT